MMEFTEAHLEIDRSQHSDFMQKFDKSAFDFKMLAIGAGIVSGIFCGANAWRGEISDRQFFCLQTPRSELQCYDKNNRHFRMTKWQWNEWGKEGRPKTVIPQDYVKASNPYKPFWAMGAFASFAVSGWMLRHLQDNERKLSVFQEIKEKTEVAQAEMQARLSLMPTYAELAIAEVELQADLELAANNRTVDLQRAEILAETEIEVTKLDAQDVIFDAQTAGMSDAEKREYIDFIRRQKTPYLSGNQTLDSVTNPGDKVEGEEQQAIADGDKYRWMKNAIGYPALVFGGMGAGKSWTTREIVWQKKLSGWKRVVALDPHGTPVEWQGVELIAGYKEIAEFMQWYIHEMHNRYEKYRNSGMTEEQWTQHLRDTNQQITVIAEEFTTWTDNIVEPMPDNAPKDWKPDADFVGKWFRCAMTESRKQLMIPLFVAHDRTMAILGNTKGLSKLRDAALLEIELIAKIDPITTEAKSSGMGKIKLPGHGEWIDIELPKLTQKRTDFRMEGDRHSQPVQTEVKSVPQVAQYDTNPEVEVSAIASKIIEILKAGNQPVSFESIRKSRRWESAPSVEEIKFGIQELTIKEFIDGDKETGYSLVNA